jgi:hypothetical protein
MTTVGMTQLVRRVVTCGAWVALLGCERPRRQPPAASSAPPGQSVADSIVAAARLAVLTDTTLPANRQLNLISTGIDTLRLSREASDSIRWTMPADSCALLVITRLTHPANPDATNESFFAAEWYGNGGFGRVSEIAPSPDWAWMAYGHLSPGREGRGAEPAPVVETLIDPCAGEACELEIVPGDIGAWRVGWTADGIALFSGKEDPPRWTGIVPATKEPAAGTVGAAVSIPWTAAALSDFSRSTSELRAPGGAYTFTAQHDSILLHGPDRHAAMTTRDVGDGVPIATTRNGEYLLAVRQTPHGPEPVVYYLVLHHAMFASSCDRRR